MASRAKKIPTETLVKEAAAKVSIRELLDAVANGGSLKLLKSREVIVLLADGESSVEVVVSELTKKQYDRFLEITTEGLPEVPMIEQKYTTARKNPLTGEIKPAGAYLEPNPQDPTYIAESNRWFNNSAIIFGIFAASSDFGLNLNLVGDELREHLKECLDRAYSVFPTPTLLDLSYEASLVNRGIPIAEQLIGAVAQAQDQANAAYALAQAEAEAVKLGLTD